MRTVIRTFTARSKNIEMAVTRRFVQGERGSRLRESVIGSGQILGTGETDATDDFEPGFVQVIVISLRR